MKFLIATEDKPYFLWQVLIQINNFSRFGYDQDTIYVVASEKVSPELQKIMSSDRMKAKFYVYSDTRERKAYLSSIRPHVLEKFYNDNQGMASEPVLYLDPDVLFADHVNFDPMLQDNCWHCSDASSYVSVDYLRKKGGDLLFAKMCDVVNLNSDIVCEIVPGGAQYLLKGVGANFWRKCYEDMEEMYVTLRTTEMVDLKPNLINSWCSDMWVLLWNSFYTGKKVLINPELCFSWATDKAERWDQCKIYHNAGRVRNRPGYFDKSLFKTESPFGKDIHVSSENCSCMYVQEIRETEKNFKELIF